LYSLGVSINQTDHAMLHLVQVGLDTWQVVYMDSNSPVAYLRNMCKLILPSSALHLWDLLWLVLSALVVPYAEISTVAFLLCECEFQGKLAHHFAGVQHSNGGIDLYLAPRTLATS
jgi:hypothetical protein